MKYVLIVLGLGILTWVSVEMGYAWGYSDGLYRGIQLQAAFDKGIY